MLACHSKNTMAPSQSETDEDWIPDNEHIFLELKHSSIHNNVLRTITNLGNEGWFADETIDVLSPTA